MTESDWPHEHCSLSNPMRHDQHITHPMTYLMTDPLMKTKTMNMTRHKMKVQNCDVRAVSHSCDVFILCFALLFLYICKHSPPATQITSRTSLLAAKISATTSQPKCFLQVSILMSSSFSMSMSEQKLQQQLLIHIDWLDLTESGFYRRQWFFFAPFSPG